MNHTWIVAAVLLTGCLTENKDVHALGLVLLAQVGIDDFERAAFIALDDDGCLQLIEWPWTHGFRRTEWKGPLPPNVVGIIHTHPKHIPLPSADDIRTATRLKIPVIALTPRSLCAAAATGDIRCAAMPQK